MNEYKGIVTDVWNPSACGCCAVFGRFRHLVFSSNRVYNREENETDGSGVKENCFI